MRSTAAQKELTPLREYSLDQIPPSPTIVFIGKRGRGKTTAMMHIAYHWRKKVPTWLCFSGTDAANGDWSTLRLPQRCVMDEWKPEVIHNLIERRMAEKYRARKQGQLNFQLEPMGIIIEDLMYDSGKIMKDPWFLYLIMNGRHLNIFLMISVQYIIQLDTDVRANVDLTLMFAENSKQNLKRAYDNFGGPCENIRDFSTYMQHYVDKPGKAMVFDNRTCSQDIRQYMYYWKSDESVKNEHWRLGSDQFWAACERRDRNNNNGSNNNNDGPRKLDYGRYRPLTAEEQRRAERAYQKLKEEYGE